jgi:hypothetical protein
VLVLVVVALRGHDASPLLVLLHQVLHALQLCPRRVTVGSDCRLVADQHRLARELAPHACLVCLQLLQLLQRG